MILKALYDYYQRCDNLPRYGMEFKEIGFLLVIDKDGKFIRFEDRRIDKKRAQQFLVKKSVSRSSNLKANYLYDNSAYVFGYSNKGEANDKRCFETFKACVESIHKVHYDNDDIKAIYSFYQNDRESIIDELKQDQLWEEIEKNLNKKFSFFSFLIEGDTQIVAEKTHLILENDTKESINEKICIISGIRSQIVKTTTATMIPNSQATAKLVSFQTNSGYDSYGKSQGQNAPIGKEAEFAYTTALNHLLRPDSRNKFHIGNRTFVFWASNNNEVGQKSEDCLFNLFTFNDVPADNPNQGVEQVRKVFEAIYSGVLQTSLDDKFYILGLAPNSARIAVAYWAEIPLKDFAERIIRHFNDMQVFDDRKAKKPYMGLYAILSAVTLGGKVSDVTPNLPEATAKSIFEGIQYPYPLYSGCIRRIRAEQSLTITRVAIIKAYLNRLNNNEQKIKIMLDNQNTNQGYLCGRLFAVLDKIQHEAKDQHSIKERYMNAASSTPSSVFSTILNLSSHHSKKLDKGLNKFYEELKEEIIDKIGADGFPSHLDLQDQGRFFVGFYHQQKAFYTKKEEQNESNNN